MIFRDGWWWVEHDHVSRWKPREDWLRKKVGKEGVDWISQNATFNQEIMAWNVVTPLQWGIKDPALAMMFELTWQ